MEKADKHKTDIGKRIAEYRKEAKLTQKELADLVGVSLMSIGRYERGDSMPDADILDRIAEAIGVSTFNLMYDKDLAAAINDYKSQKVSDIVERLRAVIDRLNVSGLKKLIEYGELLATQITYTEGAHHYDPEDKEI